MLERILRNKSIILILFLALLLPVATGCGSNKPSDSMVYKNSSQSEALKDVDGGLGTAPLIPEGAEKKKSSKMSI